MSELTEKQRKKARQTVKAHGISKPKAVKASTTLIGDGGDSSYIRNDNHPSPQPPGIPGTPHNDRGQSSTPGPSTIHDHPNLAPQNPSRSVPSSPLRSNQAPSRSARSQQPGMSASMARQSSDTGRPRSQDHTISTQHNSSRPPSAHSRASSGGAPPNDTASASQRGSSDSSRSHSSTVSFRDPFEYDSPENKKRLGRN
ncbi:uncharacterized protein EAE98_004364 [Botrytis deweyae]|uniref:Uncharacterized protein n=1 Tax=Botrytis deweyae TaxID=2478750 RepID=A0ABQ7IR39_9HELO|nr:uncharacterized protein EAE98_004364 [Botrytis deweyae]KAF7931628.1 hypothetical protein EAE98_004364 [Botrytis deweyae]